MFFTLLVYFGGFVYLSNICQPIVCVYMLEIYMVVFFYILEFCELCLLCIDVTMGAFGAFIISYICFTYFTSSIDVSVEMHELYTSFLRYYVGSLVP